MCWQLWLTLGAAFLELAGIALVVLDVLEVQRQARAVVRKNKVVPIGQDMERDKALPITPVGGAPPTVEQRLGRLERAVGELRAEIDERIDRVEDALRGDVQGAVLQAREHAEQRDTDLRRFLADQLDTGIGRRWLGAGLFAAGLTAQTAANVIGIV